MTLKGLVIIGLMVVGTLAALFEPLWGILAYLGDYYLWPEQQWWGAVLVRANIRVSFTIGAVTGVGFLLHWSRLRRRWPSSLFHRQELLLFVFVAWIALTLLWQVKMEVGQESSLVDKMVKVALMCFIVSQSVRTTRHVEKLLWFVFLVGGVMLGWEALNAPSSWFVGGRLDRCGGPDFNTANFIAAHFLACGIVGVTLLLQRPLWQAAALMVPGALVANGMMLTKSRGSFVAICAVGIAAWFTGSREVRKRAMLFAPIVAIGLFAMVDKQFVERIETIWVGREERDASAASRLDVWRGALAAARDYPFGVGVDRFYSIIGHYEPKHVGRDAHNTYLRCLVELGIPGFLLFMALQVSAFRSLRRAEAAARAAGDLTLPQIAYGLRLVLVGYLVMGVTGTFLYIESVYYFLVLPVCLERAASLLDSGGPSDSSSSRVGDAATG